MAGAERRPRTVSGQLPYIRGKAGEQLYGTASTLAPVRSAAWLPAPVILPTAHPSRISTDASFAYCSGHDTELQRPSYVHNCLSFRSGHIPRTIHHWGRGGRRTAGRRSLGARFRPTAGFNEAAVLLVLDGRPVHEGGHHA